MSLLNSVLVVNRILWKCRDYFSVYADTCFASFGDRVKDWITINEPLQTAINGYGVGIFSPGRNECSSTEPYLVAHHQLLAHAAAVSIYPSKYKVYCSITFFCLFHLEIFILWPLQIMVSFSLLLFYYWRRSWFVIDFIT